MQELSGKQKVMVDTEDVAANETQNNSPSTAIRVGLKNEKLSGDFNFL